MKVLVLNGPNLGRLDIRDSSIYGDMSYPALVSHIESAAKTHGFEADVRQSNDESEIIGWLHEAADSNTPVIINPAAFTHYSYAIRDAADLVKAPLIEVHLSNRFQVVHGVKACNLTDLSFMHSDIIGNFRQYLFGKPAVF